MEMGYIFSVLIRFLTIVVARSLSIETIRYSTARACLRSEPPSSSRQPEKHRNMAIAIAAQGIRSSVRHFSAHRPRPDTRTSRFVASSCLVSMVVLPFVPPALESSRERNSGYPNNKTRSLPPLCFHAR
ncbi:hypothetical protein BGW36DRAFT_112053 [Talaromyces proteolyticus]|uniref:Secreted protein n=1 Tax=Talaromyces proteolyticus TaxID=1131652 RepID=A0AAD4L2R2_9EURO|nr:uncharacterized protein BGW36DRAFT_112053 [Talaromyces proteolyticus]KAH8702149.1 hypothetical protein BGW36DRAFT_112053 [Talaromyces proteolyticus]